MASPPVTLEYYIGRMGVDPERTKLNKILRDIEARFLALGAGPVNQYVTYAALEEILINLPGGGGVVETIVGGLAIDVDDTDPANPVVSVIPVDLISADADNQLVLGGDSLLYVPPGGTGIVETIVEGNGIVVDATDPANPEVAVFLSADADNAAVFGTDTGVYVPTVVPGGQVDSVVAGTNISVDNTDPANPVVSATGGSGGQVDSVVAGDGIAVDNTDPINPEVSAAISTDANNILTFGTDDGLYVPTPTPAIATFATLMRRSSLGSVPQNVNRHIVTSAATTLAIGTTFRQTPDKRYCAFRANAIASTGAFSLGLLQENSASSQVGDNAVVNNNRTMSWGLIISGGNWLRYHGSTAAYGAIAAANGAVIVMYVDFSTGRIWWQINGVIPLSGDPATGANPAYSDVAGQCVPGATCALLAPSTNGDIEFDFTSSSPFGATIAAGYTAWNL